MEFHQLTVKEEGNNYFSTVLFENVVTVPLSDVDPEGDFYKLSYIKATNEIALFSDKGVYLFRVHFKSVGSKLVGTISDVRISPLPEFFSHLIPYDHSTYLSVTYFGQIFLFNPSSKEFVDVDLPSITMKKPHKVANLGGSVFLFTNEQSNHQYLRLHGSSGELIKEMENIGSLS